MDKSFQDEIAELLNKRTIHLAMDIESPAVYQLPEDRRKAFSDGVVAFAKELREAKIPTFWATQTEQGDSLLTPSSQNRVDMGGIDMGPSDFILLRDGATAFAATAFNHYVSTNNVQTFLLSGIDTSTSVTRTALSVLAQKKECILVFDKMADATLAFKEFGKESDPQSHVRALYSNLKNYADRAHYARASVVLAALRPKVGTGAVTVPVNGK